MVSPLNPHLFSNHGMPVDPHFRSLTCPDEMGFVAFRKLGRISAVLWCINDKTILIYPLVLFKNLADLEH